MLPPQLRSGLSTARQPALTLRPAQARTFWQWRRPTDWTSHLDPLYARFHRIRTLKTRAKLLKNLRRRGKFDWDVHQRPFFSPRSLQARSASHWGWDGNGNHRAKKGPWDVNDEQNSTKNEGPKQGTDGNDGFADGKGYELSAREKVWKQRMELIRKQIERDPYEAVFGKRFEPFWSPLVPSWMREEMGLQAWPQQTNQFKDTPAAETKTKEPETVKAEEHKGDSAVHAKPVAEQEARNASKSYSYASSTSWDSWTNKTRKTEWDSVSGKTKRYEYDPISNRMVTVEAPPPTSSEALKNDIAKNLKSPVKDAAMGAKTPDPRSVDQEVPKPGSVAPGSRTDTYKEMVQTLDASVRKALEDASHSSKSGGGLAIKQSVELRKSIPIPPPLSQPSHSIPLGFQPMAVGPLKSTAVASEMLKRPSALTKVPEEGVDTLTASDVRANMGKYRQAAAPTPSEVSRAQDHQVDAILQERDLARGRIHGKPVPTQWDQAELGLTLDRELESLRKKKEKLIKDERGLFHIERQKQELLKLDNRIKEIITQVDKLTKSRPEIVEGLKTSLQRAAEARTAAASVGALQPSLERMQSKELSKIMDEDDAAAHESTEPLETAPTSNVPKDWAKQAELLQSDRVRRTASRRPFPWPIPRFVDDMNARKLAFEAARAPTAEEKAAKEKADKANAMLEAEVKEQKLRMQIHEGHLQHHLKPFVAATGEDAKLEKINAMHEERMTQMQAHESRYAQKVKSLKHELETAYRQSAVHSEKHLERIQALEQQLEKAQSAVGNTGGNTEITLRSEIDSRDLRYAQKIKSLRQDLEIAYRQSAVHSEKHLERIRALEEELEKANQALGNRKETEGAKAPAVDVGAEGDLGKNVARFCGSGRWYKQAAPGTSIASSVQATDEAAQKDRDQSLVRQVREIYESRYGVIDTAHRQPLSPGNAKSNNNAKTASAKNPVQVVEVESNVDLGEELARYEKEHLDAYRFQQDGAVVGAEIAAQEKAAHEAQGAAVKAEKQSQLVDDAARKVVPTERADSSPSVERPEAIAKPTVDWAEPPVYKVLAYDSGNDFLSTATTTSNFCGSESPISIPQALSQLYAPARFVPHFAQLQSEGFQVIFGSRDMLVLRQVKSSVSEETGDVSAVAKKDVGLEDHGLIDRTMDNAKLPENGDAQASRSEVDSMPKTPQQLRKEIQQRMKGAAVNPVDGTSWRPKEANPIVILPTGEVERAPQTEGGKESASKDWDDLNAVLEEEMDDNTEIRHYPRVKREEPHFSGGRLPRRMGPMFFPGVEKGDGFGAIGPDGREHLHFLLQDMNERSRRSRRSAVRWALGTGLVAAGLAYGMGATAEKFREDKEDLLRALEEAKRLEAANRESGRKGSWWAS